MNITDLHEPFRKQIERYSLIDSLFVIFNYMQLLQFNRPVADSIEIHPEIAKASKLAKSFYEWELDLITRELLQHAPPQGIFSLRKWDEFSATINALKKLEEFISERADQSEDILWELGRIAHRQFPWQKSPNHRTLARYYKIFSRRPIDELVKRKLGLTTNQFYRLGLAFVGHFLGSFSFQHPIDVASLDLTEAHLQKFVRLFSKPLSALASLAKESESLDENFAFSQNPLKIYPLVHLFLDGQHQLVAPIPSYLFQRFTEGLYYELVSEPDFGNAFGDSFQEYVGEVANAVLPSNTFSVTAEAPYIVAKDRKDSVDWIVSDSSGHLFIECKTKRIRLASKFGVANNVELKEDLEKLASFIVQTYKTILDARANLYPHWKQDALPLYPVIVTLEEWYTISPNVTSFVDEQVTAQLKGLGIDLSILQECPYTIASCADLELLTQIIALRGIEKVMHKKARTEKRLWNVTAVLHGEFKVEIQKLDRDIFRDDLDAIHPAMRRAHRTTDS